MTDLEELCETLENLGVPHNVTNAGMEGIVLEIRSVNLPGSCVPVVHATEYETHTGFVFYQNGKLEKVVLG
jgi:hypothetical protein